MSLIFSSVTVMLAGTALGFTMMCGAVWRLAHAIGDPKVVAHTTTMQRTASSVMGFLWVIVLLSFWVDIAGK